MKKSNKLLEWLEAIFWLIIFLFLIAISHPKFQKLFAIFEFPEQSQEALRNRLF